MFSDIYFWIEIVFAFFLGLLMLIDYIKYRSPIFRLLFILFLVILVKSLFYIGIQFTQVKMTANAIDNTYLPLYDLKYFVFQYFETIFIITLSYIFIIFRNDVEGKNLTPIKISMALQYFFSTLLVLTVVIISIKEGKADTFKTDISVIEILKSGFGRLIFIVWKMAIIIVAWVSITTIFERVAHLLKAITAFKNLIIAIFSIEVFFSLLSSLIPYYSNPIWFALQILSVVFICIYAFGNHTNYINEIQDKVDNQIREKDIILSLMREISGAMGSGDFDLNNIIKTIVEDSVKGTGARAGTILLKDNITNRLTVNYVHGLFPPTKPFKSTQGLAINENVIAEKFKSEKIAVGEGILGKVAQTGETIYIPDISKSSEFIQTIEELMTVSSFIAVPLKSRDDVFGVLSIVDDAKFFTENDLSLLETLGKQATITITQIQMYKEVLEKKQAEKEIELAAEIQLSLIPHAFPVSDKYELYGYSIPAKGVGGDYYDYIDFGNNKVALTMFDVSGKGVPASLIMVMIRSILRTIASLSEDSKDILSKLNNTISKEIVEDRYATGLYLLFDAEKGIMNYTNAGHGPMILYRAGTDTLEALDTEGMPIGIMSGAEYGQNYTILEKGDIVVIYTDGITEAMNPAHEEFGLDKLKELLKQYKKDNAKDLSNKILESVIRFVDNAPQT